MPSQPSPPSPSVPSPTSSGLDVAPRIAVLLPCYNEELTIKAVVNAFRQALPTADIYVFDNNSRDRTVEEAKAAGAQVFFERRQGKGYVVQTMFREIDADVYVMADGDGTYPAEVAMDLVGPVVRGEADMVVGTRLHEHSKSQFRFVNRLGNYAFRRLLNTIFGVQLTDLLSGYRAFSRRLVRSLPLLGGGFETEAEMTIQALVRGFTLKEVPVDLGVRPEGSHSKIRVIQDGFRILGTIFMLFRNYRPLPFFGGMGLGLLVLSLLPAAWVLADFLRTGLVNRLPSAVLATGMVLLGFLLIMVGVILDTLVRHFRELDYQVRLQAEGRQEPQPKRERP